MYFSSLRQLVVPTILALLLAATAAAQGTIDPGQGETVYNNCLGCHQQNGQGVPAAFPPVAGHVPDLVAAEGGRDYLVKVVLYGLQGEVEIAGQMYNSVMPAWAQLSDEQIADLLNYLLTAWDNVALLPEDAVGFTADEVAAQRDQDLSAADILELRQGLVLGGE